MRTERMIWWLAVVCAALLLFAPLTPRTTWLPTGRNTGGLSRITEGVGWLAIAALLGAAALVALVLGLRARRRVPVAAAGAAVAAVAFVVTAVGMGRHWIDLAHGVTSVRMQPGEPWALHPAPLVPHFAVVAAAGAVLAFALTIRWLRPAAGTVSKSGGGERASSAQGSTEADPGTWRRTNRGGATHCRQRYDVLLETPTPNR